MQKRSETYTASYQMLEAAKAWKRGYPRTQALRSGFCLAALETKSGTESLGLRLQWIPVALEKYEIRIPSRKYSTGYVRGAISHVVFS